MEIQCHEQLLHAQPTEELATHHHFKFITSPLFYTRLTRYVDIFHTKLPLFYEVL